MPVILFAVFIDLVGFGLIVPILPFLTLKYGGDPLTGTALVSIYSLMTFMAGPLWGRLSDAIGRRPALALTFLGSTVAYITLAFAETLVLLFIARAMSGAMAGNIGIVMAAMADMTDNKNRGRAMGLIGAAFGLGFAVGPALGGLLAGTGGETSIMLPGLVAAGLSASAMLMTFSFMKETRAGNRSRSRAEATADAENLPHWTSVMRGPGQVALFAMFIVVAIGQSIHFSITPFWLDGVMGWNERQVGFLLAGVGLIVAAIQSLAIGPLFRAFGEVRSMMGGAVLYTVGSLMLVTFPGVLVVVLLAFPMMMTGLTIAFPALNSLLSQVTDTRLQGTALGLSSGLSALGRVGGPLTAGVLFTPTSMGTPYLIVAAMGVIIMIWTLFFAYQPDH